MRLEAHFSWLHFDVKGEVSAVAFDFVLIRKLSACQYGHFRPSP